MEVAWKDSSDGDRALMHVFPLSANSKIPTVGSAGFKNAVPVLEAKKKWPGIMDGNYGIHPGKSDLIVFDIDIKDGRTGSDTFSKLQDKHGKLAETLVVTTPSGGFHAYFKRPASLPHVGNISIGKDIDTRCDGGYVVGTGSSIDGKGYAIFKDHSIADLPDKWVAFIESHVNGKPVSTQSSTIETGSGLISKDVGEALSHIASDDRDDWLRVGMALKSTDAGNEAFEVWDRWSQSSSKYDADNQIKTWQSLSISGGINIESIFSMAMDRGWINVPTLPSSDVVTHVVGKRNVVTDVIYPDIVYAPNGLGEEITSFIKGQGVRVQPVLAFAASIVASCVLIGRNYQTSTGLRANIPMIALAGTGMGKEGARTGIKSILTACQMQGSLGGEEIKSGQGLVSAMQRQPNSAFLLDEYGRFLEAAGNPKSGSHLKDVSSMMMKMYSSANSVYLGGEYANQKDRPQVQIEYPLCNIYATSTQSSFWGALSSTALESGELNRFCIFEGSKRPLRQRPRKKGVQESIKEWAAAINNPTYVTGITGLMPDCPITVGEDTEAMDVLDSFADACDDVLFDDDIPEHIKACSQRSHARACQIAMVLALWDNDGKSPPIIRKRHALNAVTLVKFLDAQLRNHVNEYFARSDFEADMLGLARAIKATGSNGVAPSRAVKDIAFLRQFRTKERQELINLAVEANYLVVVESKQESGQMKKTLVHVDFVK